jgi:hypothetical protein
MNKSDDGTRVIDLGGGNWGTLYPEIYYQFVSKLHNEHPDLVRAMELAQVKISDGTAIDFLNIFLGTDVTREDPMEIGYAILYDALSQRISNKLSEVQIQKVVNSIKDHSLTTGHIDGPLFPQEPNQ